MQQKTEVMAQADQSSNGGSNGQRPQATKATIEELLLDDQGLSYMDDATSAAAAAATPQPDIVVTCADPVGEEDEDELVSVSRQPSVIDCNGLEPEDPRTPPDGQEDSSSDSESLAESIYHQPPKAADREAARRLAKRLYMLEGFRHTDVAKHLSRKNDFNSLVGEEYAALFDFSDDTLDTALRKFLSRFCLQGETADQERVLLHFAKSYLRCNPDSYPTADSCHTLACALLLLNKDLHGAIGQRMTSQQFIDNLANLNEGQNYPREVLKSLYQAIRAQPILQPAGAAGLLDPAAAAAAAAQSAASVLTPEDAALLCSSAASPGSLNHSATGVGAAASQGQGLSNPGMAGDAVGSGAGGSGPGIEFRRGFLVRKQVLDAGGRRTRKGRRAWRRVFCVLKDLSLGVHKDESAAAAAAANSSSSWPDGAGELRIHHALAGLAPEYTKRRHVWRLRLAIGAELLLQASSQADADAWVETVNRTAALLSAPALPAPVGSQLNSSYPRPLLPSVPTSLTATEQLAKHKEQAASVEKELQSFRGRSGTASTSSSTALSSGSTPTSAAPGSPAAPACQIGGAELQRHVAFLQHELVRYGAYIQLLDAELAAAAAASVPSPALLSPKDSAGADSTPNIKDNQQQRLAPIAGVANSDNDGAAVSAASPGVELYEIV